MSLVIVGATLFFLVDQSRPAFRSAGIWNFFTTSVWNPGVGHFGVARVDRRNADHRHHRHGARGAAGRRDGAVHQRVRAGTSVRAILTSAIDLLAALPSLLFGIWGLKVLQAHLVPVSHFIAGHLSVVPFLRLHDGDTVVGSSFIAGVVVALMITPIITSVTRDVMAQVPREQCEGALALGGTRWGMIRDVILPFARGGIVGGALLGFGRAIGETVAIAVVIASPLAEANTHILKGGAASIASFIAIHFGEADSVERSGLIAAGLALFILSFAVNFLARLIVRRARVNATTGHRSAERHAGASRRRAPAASRAQRARGSVAPWSWPSA